MDMTQWIFQKDMAEWLSRQPPLSVSDQVNCILSAPHRNLKEKWEGLRSLEKKYKELADIVSWMEYMVHWAYEDERTRNIHYFYETEIFYCGIRDEFQVKRLFRNAVYAMESVREQIMAAAREAATCREQYCAVLYRYQSVTPTEYHNTFNCIIDLRGEPVYLMPEFSFSEFKTSYHTARLPKTVWDWDDHFLRIPYTSGTIVEIKDNPYSLPMKGILANEDEIDQERSDSSPSGQWLIYPDHRNVEQTGGIGVIRLDADSPLLFGFGILPPSRQFFSRYEGELDERDAWLLELSRVIRQEPSVLEKILSCRQPGIRSFDKNHHRLEYVRGLCKIKERPEV